MGIITPGRKLECNHIIYINRSRLDFRLNGNNQAAQQTTIEQFRKNIDSQTDFSFPVIGYKLQDSYKGGLGYSPFVESAGVVFIVYTDNSNVKDTMVSALFACWPIVLIPFIMAYIAGFCIWVLVRAFMFLCVCNL